jgi:ferritin-like metal-binding protein YciE
VKLDSIDNLLMHELSDIYSAEQQLAKALPKMAEGAANADLKAAIEDHLAETEAQIERLEQIFEMLEEEPEAEVCDAMKGLLDEGKKVLRKKGDEAVKDAAIIGAAQRVEHYEIAAYGCARTYAELLGHEEVVDLLQQTLDEEKAADSKLNELALTIVNPKAAEAE